MDQLLADTRRTCSSPTSPSARTSASAPPSCARSREQYRLIAETTRAIPFELDLAQGRFTYIGPQAEKFLGIPGGALEGNRLPRRAAAARARSARAPAAR